MFALGGARGRVMTTSNRVDRIGDSDAIGGDLVEETCRGDAAITHRRAGRRDIRTSNCAGRGPESDGLLRNVEAR